MTDTAIEVVELTDLIPYEDDGNNERRTHIINEADNTHIWQSGMSAQDIVDAARITGEHVTALCGKKWVPNHDPRKYDSCEACLKIAGLIISQDG